MDIIVFHANPLIFGLVIGWIIRVLTIFCYTRL